MKSILKEKIFSLYYKGSLLNTTFLFEDIERKNCTTFKLKKICFLMLVSSFVLHVSTIKASCFTKLMPDANWAVARIPDSIKCKEYS